jgi:flagellin-specific chaperone FliS
MSTTELETVITKAQEIVGNINGTLNSQSGSNPTADLTTVITSAKQIVGGINGALNPNSTYKELTEVIKKANAIVSGLTLNLNPSNELLKMEIDKTGNYKITVEDPNTGTKNITGNLDAANLTSIQTSVAVIKGGKKQKK